MPDDGLPAAPDLAPLRDVELENAEDAVRAAAAKIGAKVAPPSTTVDVDVETK